MKTKILLLILTLLTISCSKREGEQKTGLLSHLISITDNEDKGIKEILGFYGGECKYAVGVLKSTNNEDKKYFKLELSKTPLLTKYADKVDYITSNLAIRFFKNLNQEERQNYTHIRGVVVFDNGQRIEHDYSRDQLALVEKKLGVVMKIFEIIKKKKFEDVEPFLNLENVFTYEKKELIEGLKRVDPQFGEVQEFRLFGFQFIEHENKELLDIAGMMVRDIQSNKFKVYLNPLSTKDEILSIEYDW